MVTKFTHQQQLRLKIGKFWRLSYFFSRGHVAATNGRPLLPSSSDEGGLSWNSTRGMKLNPSWMCSHCGYCFTSFPVTFQASFIFRKYHGMPEVTLLRILPDCDQVFHPPAEHHCLYPHACLLSSPRVSQYLLASPQRNNISILSVSQRWCTSIGNHRFWPAKSFFVPHLNYSILPLQSIRWLGNSIRSSVAGSPFHKEYWSGILGYPKFAPFLAPSIHHCILPNRVTAMIIYSHV